MLPFKLLWANVAESRMTALSVVPGLDPPEDRLACFVPRLEPASVHELSLEARKEALDGCVVPAVAFAAHAAGNSGIRKLLLIVAAGVLAPSVAVADQVMDSIIRLNAPALHQSRRERRDHQGSVDILVHRP